MKYVILLSILFAASAQAQTDLTKIGCRDPKVAAETKQVRDYLFTTLIKEPGAVAVSVSACDPDWATRALGGNILAVKRLPVCGVTVGFRDGEGIKRFAYKYPTGRLVYLLTNGRAGGAQLCASIANDDGSAR
ncbi:MAG: hypothetical protein ABL958_08375 [Bdellovibrionia bacterium]